MKKNASGYTNSGLFSGIYSVVLQVLRDKSKAAAVCPPLFRSEFRPEGYNYAVNEVVSFSSIGQHFAGFLFSRAWKGQSMYRSKSLIGRILSEELSCLHRYLRLVVIRR